MIARMALIICGVFATSVAATQEADPIRVPSGLSVHFHDLIRNQPGAAGLTYRFRFIAPDISRQDAVVDLLQVLTDMDTLCHDYALPRVIGGGPLPAQIIITISDRSTEFGVPSPEATQFFEAFRIEDGSCIWEEF